MKPTRVVPLVALAAIGLAVGWVAVDIVERFASRILGVPWLAAAGLWILAIAVLTWAIISRTSLVAPRQHHRGDGWRREAVPVSSTPARPHRKRMPPLVAARTAALALAASRTGSLIGGFYLGIALALIPVLGTPSGSGSFAAAATSVVACLVLTIAAVWLESMCRLRDRHDES